MEPDLRSRLRNSSERKWFFRTANARAKKPGPYSDFDYAWWGGERERESETNLSHLFVPLHDIVFDFPSVEKKSETEFTAGVLKKDQKHTKG